MVLIRFRRRCVFLVGVRERGDIRMSKRVFEFSFFSFYAAYA